MLYNYNNNDYLGIMIQNDIVHYLIVTKNLNNNEVNAKLATVFREKKQDTIPKKTSLSETNSYLFGGINYKEEDTFNIEYKIKVFFIIKVN